MNFASKLENLSKEEIWQEYCGFLDLTIEEYMQIQNRLLMEQIGMMSKCGLGERFFKGRIPRSVEEFRTQIALTSYQDYADILLQKKEHMLPGKPVVWLQTTWEGGNFPAKLAPYTENMLEVYRHNVLSALILANSRNKGEYLVRSGFKVLYTLAPLPYASGLFPYLIDSEIQFKFLPPLKEARTLSFSEQSRRGFQMSLKGGMDMFFGMSSIIYGISKNLQSMFAGSSISLKNVMSMSPKMIYRLLLARYRSKRDGVEIQPKDLFSLHGLVCIGTDSTLYKADLEKWWGQRPLEIAGGTEPTCIGTETWSKNGLVLFPDACFYEFIPEHEMLRSLRDPDYQPPTYLMNELVANQNYEMIITVLKGGAFIRYRVGDVFRCIRLKNQQDGLDIPQFEYVDRVPSVIDIAGFTRVTADEINQIIALSGLAIIDWLAVKEYDTDNHSYMHLFVEMRPGALPGVLSDAQVVKDHFSIYFRFYDSDYNDLKRLLGIDPLQVTVLKAGTIARYEEISGQTIPRLNPPRHTLTDILRLHTRGIGEGEGQ